MLSVDFTHQYGTKRISAQFQLAQGVCAIYGPSGAGKSTILNAVGGFLRPASGRITLNDRVFLDTQRGIFLPPHKRNLGVVFQDYRLFPHLTVAQNLDYAGKGLNRDIIDMLGLGNLLNRAPHSLSGGEQARVALGRALLCKPNALLLDEPLAALDAGRRAEILPYLEALRDHSPIPILYISHAMDEVARLADQILVLRDGQMVADGRSADLLRDPAMAPYFGVREMGALVNATVTDCHPDGLMSLNWGAGPVILPQNGCKTGDRLRLRILAHNIILAKTPVTGLSAQNILPAVVRKIDQGQGPGALITLHCGGTDLLARLTTRAVDQLGLTVGSDCCAIIKATTAARGDVGKIA